ncbi:MAG TPA: hypothetical protein VKT53_06760 [Candidatus Acidoferrum sp.]|nr:hypothetical protein [Candidatus Acidoferrum sp.]
MEACVESVFPRWIASLFSSERAETGPSSAEPSVATQERMPRFVHVSLDSFFASVEQQLNPKLQGRPVLVGRSNVLSASQEALLSGVKPGMSIEAASRACPRATVVPARFDRYAAFAERVREILRGFTSKVECGARADFFLDFSGDETRFADPRGTLLRMQLEILNKLGLSVSIGAGSTRSVAATASRVEGPRGMKLILRGAERGFLAKLPTTYLPAMDAGGAAELASSEVNNVGELARVPRAALESAFGKHAGSDIWHQARARDWADVRRRLQPGSLSRELAIEGGTHDCEELRGAIEYLCERIERELSRTGREAKTIDLAIRYVDRFAAQQSVKLLAPTADSRCLAASAEQLLRALFTREVAVAFVGVSTATQPVSAQKTTQAVATPEFALAANQ